VSGLERSREEIEAARLLAGGGFSSQAASRAYYAAFYAAEEALLTMGESRSTHAGVISGFGQAVVREGGLDADCGRILRRLFEGRGRADYDAEPVEPEQAEEAIADAERFVAAVEKWLGRRRA
jgi:uncharacterized protein (UPF0332 family)